MVFLWSLQYFDLYVLWLWGINKDTPPLSDLHPLKLSQRKINIIVAILTWKLEIIVLLIGHCYLCAIVNCVIMPTKPCFYGEGVTSLPLCLPF